MHGPLLAILLIVAGAPAPTRLAIHPLTSQGAAPEAVQQLDAAVRIELARIPSLSVPGEEESRRALQRPCDADVACLRAYGRSLHAAEVLFGEVRALPDSFAVTLRIFDVASGKETASKTASVNRDVEEMVWATRTQVLLLKAPRQFAGHLALALPGAERVSVNGRELTMPAELVLLPGSYAVKAHRKGRQVEAWVEVRFEQSTKVAWASRKSELTITYAAWAPPASIAVADLSPSPPSAQPASDSVDQSSKSAEPQPSQTQADEAIVAAPSANDRFSFEEPARPWPRWPAIAAIAVGAAALATGIVQEARASSLSQEIESLRGPAGIPPDKVQEVRDLQQNKSSASITGWVFIGAGAALCIGGGTYLAFSPSPSSPAPALVLAGSF